MPETNKNNEKLLRQQILQEKLCVVSCQFVSDVVYDVGVVQPPPLVLPPALDEDTWLPLKIRQMEVVSEEGKTNHHCTALWLPLWFFICAI